jgi:cystathionine gamma-synthase
VIDLEPLVEICRRRGIISIVDHTFASPFNIQPLSYGIDLVAVSATKYHGGHNDLLAGYVAGSARLLKAIEDLRGTLGSVIAPETAQRLCWYLGDMGERIAQHNFNGMTLAEMLERSGTCSRVWYPGIESHPDFKIARAQLHGFGGVVSFELQADLETSKRFVDRLLGSGLCFAGPSFGGDKNLISHVPIISHYHETPEQRAAQGISDSLIRLAIAPGNQSDFISACQDALDALE